MQYVHVFYAYPSSFYANECGGDGWFHGISESFEPVDDDTVRGFFSSPQTALDDARKRHPNIDLAPGCANYLAEFNAI